MTHPYAEILANQVHRRKNLQISIPARRLLQGFGYERRTEKIVSEIHAYLNAQHLVTTLSLSSPRDLDDKVTITCLAPIAPIMPVAAASPVATDIDATLRDLAVRALPATVALSTEIGMGSGFIVHPSGLVVTARHVVDENGYSARSVQVSLSPGLPEQRNLEGVVFWSHRQLDVALLWLIGDGPFPAIAIGDPRKLAPVQSVLAIGCPSGLYNTVSRGIVSNPRQPHRGIDYIQTDTAIDPGNSGGPLLSSDGVVGVNLWILMNVGAAKFSLPIDYLSDEIAHAVEQGREKCLDAAYCPACGYTEYEEPTWFCRNCGVEFEAAEAEETPAGERNETT